MEYSDDVSDLYPPTNEWGSPEPQPKKVSIRRLYLPPRERFMQKIVPEAIGIALEHQNQ